MKIRTGFVSNSSSSSFCVPLYYISAHQANRIHNHIEESKSVEADDPEWGWFNHNGDAWNIYEENGRLHGSTYMDNFNMEYFLRQIGVPSQYVKWDN